MSIPRTHLDAIERADAERRRMREIDEWIAANSESLAHKLPRETNALPYVRENLRDHKVTQDCWYFTPSGRVKRAVGYAPGTNPQDGPSMRVTRNGVTSIERVGRTRRHRTRVTAPTGETYAQRVARLGATGDSNH